MPSWRNDYRRYKSIFLNVVDNYRRRNDVKLFLEILLTLTTMTILIIFALKPTITTILELIKEIRTKEEVIAKMDIKIRNLVEAQNILLREQDSINLLNEAIPTIADPDKTVGQYIGMASEKGLSLLGAHTSDVALKGTPKASSKNKDLSKLPESVSSFDLSLNFDGDFEQMQEAIATVENMRRPLKIDTATFSKKIIEGEGIVINLSIIGRVPFLPSDSTSPKP